MTRSEGDSWNLASSVAATATSVAASRALATRQPDPLIVDPFAEPLVTAVGLDFCGYRMTWPAGTTVFEIDQPEVIEFKTRVLADLGATPSATRRTVGVDLRDGWPKALQDSGFDATQPSAWIAEGLLIYSGERNTARDYLSRRGWQVNVLLTEDAYAAQGFELPVSEWTALAVDSGYLTAVLGQKT